MREGIPQQPKNKKEKVTTTPRTPENQKHYAKFADSVSQRFDARTRRRLEEAQRVPPEVRTLEQQERLDWYEHSRIAERHAVINGQEVRFIGLAHVEETLLRHRELLDAAVAQAGAVVLEGTPEISLYNEEFFKRVKDKTDTSDSSYYFGSPGMVFFEGVEILAKKYNKPVLALDPSSAGTNLANSAIANISGEKGLRQMFELTETEIERSRNIAGLTASMLASSSVARTPLSEHGATPSSPDELEDIDRRKFMFGIGALALGTSQTLNQVAEANAMYGEKDGKAAPFRYGLYDYRDVVIAEGVDRLTKKRSYDGPIVFIYGAAHTDPIMNYLKDPVLREIRKLKYALYEPFKDISPPTISEYQYSVPEDMKEGRYYWKTTFTEPIS